MRHETVFVNTVYCSLVQYFPALSTLALNRRCIAPRAIIIYFIVYDVHSKLCVLVIIY